MVLERFIARLKIMTPKQRAELRKKIEKSFRRFENIEAGRTVRRKPPVQQRKGAIPPCVDRKTCGNFVKGPCGGMRNDRLSVYGCYRESDTAPVA